MNETLTVPARRSLAFLVPGRLGPWQRGRRDSRKGPSFTFTPANMASDQAMVRHFAWLAMRDSCRTQLRGPLKLVVETWRTPPPSWSAKKRASAHWITGRPDFDNTLKLIADALNKVAYDDDAQIADGHHMKRYGLKDCVTIYLEELEGDA